MTAKLHYTVDLHQDEQTGKWRAVVTSWQPRKTEEYLPQQFETCEEAAHAAFDAVSAKRRAT